jgi:hypothetical protein
MAVNTKYHSILCHHHFTAYGKAEMQLELMTNEMRRKNDSMENKCPYPKNN